MDRTERFYKIRGLMEHRRVVTFPQMQASLEVSRATLRRDLQYLRERLHEPIEWSAQDGGYRLVSRSADSVLHGPLYSAQEVHALLTLDHLLRQIDPAGVLGAAIEPLEQRLAALLDRPEEDRAQLRQRVRIIGLARRPVQPRYFQRVGTALIRRKQLRIRYLARSTARLTRRDVSPLRLVHYRDNWYLDAWCHLRDELRSFAVDAIEDAAVLDAAAKEVSDAQLDATFGPGYGIFSGRRIRWARLRFTPQRARWIASEEWHPQQKGRWDDQGRWLLDVPYADPRELIKDILQHIPDVDVLGPPGLRAEVLQRLERALAHLGASG